jgi:hypothetical protein
VAEKLEIIITARDQASKVFGDLGHALSGALKVGFGVAAVGAGLFATGLGIAIGEAMEAEVNVAKLEAVLKSTGGVAGVTSEEAQGLADSLSTVTRFSDDAILSAETMLLTFTNIGEDIFPQATEMALNMGEMFGSVDAASLQLGKALQNPIEGVTALRRVGVQLTDAQEEQIKAFMEAGDVAGAQAVIMKELEREFGGVARAAGATAAGQLTIFKNKLLNIAEGVGTTVLPIFVALGNQIADRLVPFFEQLAYVVGNFISGLATGDMSMVKETLGWLLGNQGWSNDIAFFLVDVAVALKDLLDIFLEFGVSGVFTLQFWQAMVDIFGSEWGNRIRAVAVTFGELYLQINDLLNRVVVPFIQEHAPLFINAFERVGAVLAVLIGGPVAIGIVTALVGGLIAALGALLSPIVLIIAGVTALSIAYDTNFLGMKDAVDAFVSWFTGTAMPAISAFIKEDVLPALKLLKEWFVDDALPAIIDFVTNDAIPALQWLWGELVNLWDKVKPKLQELALWFLDDALPAIRDFVVDTAIPAIQWLWGELMNLWDKVQPKLADLFKWVTETGLPAIRDAFETLKDDVIVPLITGLKNFWDEAQPKLKQFYDWVTEKFGWLKTNIFDPLLTVINDIIGAIETLIDWIGQIDFPEPPSWLNTGSLTPGWLPFGQHGGSFAGLFGTGEAGRELVYAPGGAMVFPNDVTERVINNWNLSVNSAQSSGSVIDDFHLMEAMT